MNQLNPASCHDLLRSDEQQIEMSANMFRCLVEVRFYLSRIRQATDSQTLIANCNNTINFLYQFQLAELENLRQNVNISQRT